MCATSPWDRAPTTGQTAALIRGMCTMVYDMGLEPMFVQKAVCHTKGTGIRARGTERYHSQTSITCGLIKESVCMFVTIGCLCVRVQCITTRIRPLGTKATG